MDYSRANKCDNSQGGNYKIYLFPYVDYLDSEIVVENNILTRFPFSVIYEVEANNINFNSDAKEDKDILYNENISFQLKKLEETDLFKDFVAQDWRIIIKDNNNKLRLFGLKNGLKGSYKEDSGTNRTDFNGYSFSFEGKEDIAAPYLADFKYFFVDNGNGYNPFIMEVTTTTENETFTIPTTGTGYNYDVRTNNNQFFINNSGNLTITFEGVGNYDIEIIGYFPRIYFNNSGDKTKLTDIKQWGDIKWTSFENSFFGCSNLTGTFTDAPDLSIVANLVYMFRGATSFNTDISNWDVSNVTNFYGMFILANSFNQDISGWDVSNANTLSEMFANAISFNQDLSSWDVSNVTSMFQMFANTNASFSFENWDISQVSILTNFLINGSLSTVNYDATLIGWEQTLQTSFPSGVGYLPTINVNFGSSQFTLGSASETSRTSLINNFGWTITDGGGV